ncbi:hypothetical protein TNCV_1631681 [Trichonephila clavipes]|nr:hypothetical protein TNCV_1631681 [Trichonephila clavipes]
MTLAKGMNLSFKLLYSKPSIKLSTYDGKSSWQVKDPILHSGGCKPVGLLDQGLPRLDFDALVNALSYASEKMCEGLQQTPAEVTAAESVRNAPRTGDGRREAFTLAKQHEKDRHPIRAVNESDTSNSSVERLERKMRSFMNRVESLMSQKADGKKTLKMLDLRSRRASAEKLRWHAKALKLIAPPEGGVEKTN